MDNLVNDVQCYELFGGIALKITLFFYSVGCIVITEQLQSCEVFAPLNHVNNV